MWSKKIRRMISVRVKLIGLSLNNYDKVILFETKNTSYFNMIGAGGMNVHPRRRRIARERYVERHRACSVNKEK